MNFRSKAFQNRGKIAVNWNSQQFNFKWQNGFSHFVFPLSIIRWTAMLQDPTSWGSKGLETETNSRSGMKAFFWTVQISKIMLCTDTSWADCSTKALSMKPSIMVKAISLMVWWINVETEWEKIFISFRMPRRKKRKKKSFHLIGPWKTSEWVNVTAHVPL